MIWSLFVASTALTSKDSTEFLCAELWDLGTVGLEETPDGLLAYFEDATDPAMVSHLVARLAATIETVVPAVFVLEAGDRDPILIGKRFVLVPAQRIVLPIDAAMAVGSGRHESTQLCLLALEQFLQPGQTVYDIGCGSGILALAALKLGAATVIACDIEELALNVARRHFPGALFVGSADCFPSRSADIVFSNITGPVNDHIAVDLKRIIKSDGLVIISGFTAETAPRSFNPEHLFNAGDWQCWVCNPSNISANPSSHDLNQHKSQWWL